jgi:ribose 5-phosphate isomerase A
MAEQKVDTTHLKQAAAEHAAQQLQSGMLVGLGSGSTARLAVAAIGARVQQGLDIIGVPTSEATAQQAEELGIKLATLGQYPQLDVTIDGADEVEVGTLYLVKGGGGNQLREKIVASASKRLVIIVDESKLVKQLGTKAPIPVEVAQFGWQSTAHKLQQIGARTELRGGESNPYITDGGNYILDSTFGPIERALHLQSQLDSITGVVEHGLFLGLTSQVFIGTPDGVAELDPLPDR